MLVFLVAFAPTVFMKNKNKDIKKKGEEILSGMTYSFEKGYLVIKVETGKYEDKVVGVYAGEDKNGKSLFSNHIIEDSYEKIGNYEIKIKLKKL